MTKPTNILNKKEKNIRKFWLRFAIFRKFIFPLIISVISYVLFYDFIKLLNNFYPSGYLSSFSQIFTNFTSLLKLLTVNALIFWWVYHCAYKKSGTALLLFFLIINPIIFIIYLGYICLLVFLQYSPEFTESWSQFAIQMSTDLNIDSNMLIQFMKNALKFLITLFTLEMILTVIWFISCLKLRNVNKKLKRQTPTQTLSNPA